MPQLPQIDSVKAPDKIVAQATRARRFPWLNIPFILVVALLVSYGLVVVMSAVANDRDYSFTNQLAGVALGIVFMVLVWRFDYRRLSDFTMLFLIVNVALILSPHIPGLGTDAGMGAQSWLKLGIQVQPGEFAKITVILLDASIMARYGGRLDDPREYVKALGLMLVPFACIMTQPDLGTGLVYLCIGAVALVVGGARPKYLLITLAAFVAAVIAVFVVDQIIYNSTGEYKLLKQYQRNRLLVFLDPDIDPTGESYNLKQAQIAIDNANVIIFVTDIKTGMTAADQEVAGMLQRSKKPIVLAVNKMDSTGAVDPDFYEFYNLGLGDPIAVSAVHGHGTGDLLDACLQYFPPEDEEEEDSDVIQVAIIGKPNVGKSSLTNRILGQQRVIVSNVAGTTRDAIDSYFENETGKYNFIDTAGMRKKSKVDDNIEKYSVLRATMAIERSDVCLIMIDAQDGVTEQDTKVAGLAHEAGKACIIVVNKWDLVEKDDKTMDRMREDIRRDLSYMTYAPIVFISALTGQRVTRLFELINYVREQSSMRITTGMLNSVLADAQTRVQPPTDKGRRLKIYYMTQVGIRPPHFVVFCNDKKLFHFSYRRYLENQIRSVFGLEGTPIIMSIRQKGEEDA